MYCSFCITTDILNHTFLHCDGFDGTRTVPGKPNLTGFSGTCNKNARNTVTQHPHYFTVALLRFSIEGVLKYDYYTVQNVLCHYFKITILALD